MAKKTVTIETLANMVKHGFDHVDQRFDEMAKGIAQKADKADVDQQFNGINKHLVHVDGELLHLNATTTTIQRDVAEIRKQFVRRDEFDDLFGRVSYLERKLGIKSGK